MPKHLARTLRLASYCIHRPAKKKAASRPSRWGTPCRGLCAALLLAGALVARANEPALPAPLPTSGLEAAASPSAAEPAADPAPAAPEEKKATSVFANVPPVFIFPRLGLFPVFPEGPGYYSLQDFLCGPYRDKPPAFPFGRLSLKAFPFYDADFRYLDNPKNTQHDWSDIFKRQQIGCDWLFSSGAEVRYRFMNEVDSRLTGFDNQYSLLRTMVYGSLWYQDRLGFYAQYLDAQAFSPDLPVLPIDVNRSDMVDVFIDLKLFEWKDKPVYVRGGRQEMLLGSERLVSPLEWANTLRTFEGVRFFRQGEKFDFTAFWLQPVIPNPSHFDSVGNKQNFSGLWGTYRPKKGDFFDLYYLNLDRALPIATGQNGVRGGYDVNTVGTRYVGSKEGFLWDFEGMMQFGKNVNQSIVAGAATAGLGYVWKDVPMEPQFWTYYDYASGDANPGFGPKFSTFNQLFPFGHYYLGYLDLVGRQNIHDFNMQFMLFPTKWITTLVQYHNFRLDSPRSPLFSAAGVPLRRSATGAAGDDVGNEIDWLMNIHLNAHQDVLLGYSKLYAGSFIKQTGPAVSPELFYAQWQFRW